MKDLKLKLRNTSHIHWVVRGTGTPRAYFIKPQDKKVYFYKLFIMNQETESYRQNLYMSVGVMKD